MDKFSLYDFMSYFLPGVVGVLFLYKLSPNAVAIHYYSDTVNVFLFSIAGILVGLAIHSVTFFLIQFSWFKWLAKKPIDSIVVNNPKTIKPSVVILQEYFNKKTLSREQLFDEAYYFLEYNDKITVAKSFQSGYFFLRNLITLMLFIVPISIGFYFFVESTVLKQTYYKYAVVAGIAIPVLALVAAFYRVKMVERVFNTYKVALENKIGKE
jgi:hypothetical protein